MPNYFPIPVTPSIRADHSDLLQLRWANVGIVADFILPQDDQSALRVRLERVEIIRIVEEMPISSESEETANEGIIPGHFAYLVQGAAFWNQQSAVFKTVVTTAKHYRFFTANYCLDVISTRGPAFTVVAKQDTGQ